MALSVEERRERLIRLRARMRDYVAKTRARLLAEKRFVDAVAARSLGTATEDSDQQEDDLLQSNAKALLGLDVK